MIYFKVLIGNEMKYSCWNKWLEQRNKYKKKKQKNHNDECISFKRPQFRHAESITNGKSTDDFDRWIAFVYSP